jgi:hypothetical protein
MGSRGNPDAHNLPSVDDPCVTKWLVDGNPPIFEAA